MSTYQAVSDLEIILDNFDASGRHNKLRRQATEWMEIYRKHPSPDLRTRGEELIDALCAAIKTAK